MVEEKKNNLIRNRKPEILAPAGTYEAMEAAVKAGCDAVYAGGSLFSARAYAGNFDEESFIRAIDYCHLFGVKVYMTLNTLLKENEIEHVTAYLMPYYRAGLDAVLVQDMGVLKILRDNFPDLPVHASTQMSISSAYGARLAKELGLERIVPARELSLEEIRSIKEKEEIEIETFVHGAMCFAYSGKCLLSSFAGGRSGNRGRCAQPCRKCYELHGDISSKGMNYSEEPLAKEYLLSLKDLCVLEDLPYLIDAGIDSFKIEGRMKNPSYVAAAVSAYKTTRDLYLELREEEKSIHYPEKTDQKTGLRFENFSEAAKQKYLDGVHQHLLDLRDIYNRGGFYNGYYFTDKGKKMAALKRPNHLGLRIGTVSEIRSPKISILLEEPIHKGDVIEIRDSDELEVELTSAAEGAAGETVLLNGKELKKLRPGMEVWRTRNEALLIQIEEEILKKERTLPVSAGIIARIGEPLRITFEGLGCGKNGENVSCVVEGNAVEAASKAPTEEQALLEKLKKSGGSGLEICRADCEIDGNAFVPMSTFNALRREAADELKKTIVSAYHR